MRSDRPIPGNPWPHDMVLGIDDTPQPFCDLLFVRQAWGLDIAEVPALEATTRIPAVAPPSRDTDDLRRQWRRGWRAGWQKYDPPTALVDVPDRATLDRIAATPDAELDDAFRAEMGPTVAGDDLDAFNAWQESLRDPHHLPLEQTPERVSLPALIGAWEHGLKTIVQLPFRDPYAVSRNEQVLVVSRRTRWDPDLFSAALARH